MTPLEKKQWVNLLSVHLVSISTTGSWFFQRLFCCYCRRFRSQFSLDFAPRKLPSNAIVKFFNFQIPVWKSAVNWKSSQPHEKDIWDQSSQKPPGKQKLQYPESNSQYFHSSCNSYFYDFATSILTAKTKKNYRRQSITFTNIFIEISNWTSTEVIENDFYWNWNASEFDKTQKEICFKVNWPTSALWLLEF